MTSFPIRDPLADDLITPQDTSHRGSSTRSAAPSSDYQFSAAWPHYGEGRSSSPLPIVRRRLVKPVALRCRDSQSTTGTRLAS
jgi:hypothetical protein